MHDSALGIVREKLVVGLIALLVGLAVYAALGLAWSFKHVVEISQRLRHPFS